MKESGEYADLPGTGCRLGPVGNIELAIDTGCVGFDSAWGEYSSEAILFSFSLHIPYKGWFPNYSEPNNNHIMINHNIWDK